jgi:ATP-dependent RNA helicase DeaD
MTVPTVEQVYYEVDRRYKVELLTRLIDLHDLKLGIIFCNTKRMVDDLVDHLEAQGYMADRLHGDMTQAMRDRVMNKFRKSGLEFLVATDIAARGIDVDDVEVVFNYDLPYDPEDYVHRIGRTGRAGKSGRAISLVPYRELFQIRNIERFTNVRIERAKIPTEDQVAEAKGNIFLEKLRSLLASGEYQHHNHLVERLLAEDFSSTDIASALIHLLQSGESTKPAPREEPTFERPERPPYRDRRDDRGGRYDDRPARNAPYRDDDRRERAPYRDARAERSRRFEDRPPRGDSKFAAPAKSKVTPWKSAAAKPAPAPKPAAPSAKIPSLPEERSAPAKTFSDAEILTSVKTPEPKPASKLFLKPKPAPAAPKPKASRATPAGQTRLWVSLGAEQGVAPIDFVNSVAGETGLPGKIVGTVDVRERHSFVDVASEHANGIIAKLNRANIKGHKVKVKVA